MRTKRNASKQHGAEISGHFEVKAIEKGAVIIEGFANVPVKDRGKDVIKPDAWELANFLKNPVILFNHGNDPDVGAKPVGKALEVKPTDKGLWLRVRMTSSKGEVLRNIVDLVREGSLVAFSVGFDPIESHRDGDANVITKAELYEVSIVAVPMNQESLFRVVAKAYADHGKVVDLKTCKSVLKLPQIAMSLVKAESCREKGAWIAGAIHTRIFDLQVEGKDRAELLSMIEEASGLSSDELLQVLAGNVTPTPDSVIEAVSEVLGLDADKLRELDAADVNVEQGDDESEETEEPEQEAENESEESSEESEEGETEELGGDRDDDDEERKQDSEEGEEDSEENRPELSALGLAIEHQAQGFGFSREALAKELCCTDVYLDQVLYGEVTRPTDEFLSLLKTALSIPEDDLKSLLCKDEDVNELRDVVVESIPTLIADGKSADKAVGLAISKATKAKLGRPTEDDYSFFFEVADRYAAKQNDDEDEDEESHENTATSNESTEEKADQPMLENEPTTGTIAKEETPSDLGNPIVDALLAQNALMGTLIQEVKLLRGTMEGGVQNAQTTQEPETQGIDDESEPEVKQAPSDDMSDEELEKAREARAEEFGIEITEDSALKFPAGFPTELSLYADPVNLKFPIDSADRSANARARFKQFADELYKEDRSKAAVHSRIVGRLLALGSEAAFDPEDSLDALLSEDLKERLSESSAESEGEKSFRNYLNDLSNRLKRVE